MARLLADHASSSDQRFLLSAVAAIISVVPAAT